MKRDGNAVQLETGDKKTQRNEAIIGFASWPIVISLLEELALIHLACNDGNERNTYHHLSILFTES
jgi:hypothetical protein